MPVSDVRDWARAEGISLEDDSPIPDDVLERYGDALLAGKPEPEPDKPTEETRPATPRRRRWRLFGGDDTEKPKPQPKVEKPVRRGRRKSLEPLLGPAWGGIGAALIHTRMDVPVGRAMVYQGPAAGMVLDDALSGTLLDHLLQPVVRRMDSTKAVGSLLGLPLLVAVIERQPQAAQPLMPVLRSAMVESLVLGAESLKKQKAHEEKVLRTMEDLGISIDDVDGMIRSLFQAEAPPEPQ